jgi:hypothetical protein
MAEFIQALFFHFRYISKETNQNKITCLLQADYGISFDVIQNESDS